MHDILENQIQLQGRARALQRYGGRMVLRILYVREMILNSIRLETLSQLRDFRIGVMCWNFGAWTTV